MKRRPMKKRSQRMRRIKGWRRWSRGWQEVEEGKGEGRKGEGVLLPIKR